jgi:hypothetical protein
LSFPTSAFSLSLPLLLLFVAVVATRESRQNNAIGDQLILMASIAGNQIAFSIITTTCSLRTTATTALRHNEGPQSLFAGNNVALHLQV